MTRSLAALFAAVLMLSLWTPTLAVPAAAQPVSLGLIA
jgi:hypothetical protein